MGQSSSHTSVCELKLSTSSYPNNFTTKTVNFSPMFDDSIICYFEARYTRMSNVLNKLERNSVFDLVLKRVNKRKSSASTSSWQIDVSVTVNYSDGSLFKEYKPKTGIQVEQVDFVAFESVQNAIHLIGGLIQIPTSHSKMKDGLNIVCKIVFRSPDLKISPTPKSLSDFTNNFKSAYESGVFHDFVFNVEDKSFQTHKFVLAAHSPVFRKMMSQDFQESKVNNTTITDATPEIFEMFLKYLYTGEICDESWPSVKDLYYLADKYDVVVLKNNCTDLIESFMSIDLVCDVLKLAYTYEDPNLKSAAKQFAMKNLKELISRDDWKSLVAMHPLIGYEVLVDLAPK